MTAALDPRIACVVPFNFGGPQPEYAYPLPDDPDRDFDWFGGGVLGIDARPAHWRAATASLPLGHRRRRRAAAADLRPRVRLGPRSTDPAWPRLQKIFGFYGAPDNLASPTAGQADRASRRRTRTATTSAPSTASMIYPALKNWFDMPMPEEYIAAQEAGRVAVPDPEAVQESRAAAAARGWGGAGSRAAAAARSDLAGLTPEERGDGSARTGRDCWATWSRRRTKSTDHRKAAGSGAKFERMALEVEPGIVVPLVLLLAVPAGPKRDARGVRSAQDGKQAFLKQPAEDDRRLLDGGVAVCLADVRGTGETKPVRTVRGLSSGRATTLSGEPNGCSARRWSAPGLRDCRSVLRHPAEPCASSTRAG